MKKSLSELVQGVIDYAGLFPPAKLEMEPAIRNFIRYREDSDSWMLSNFICPASRLGELAEYRDSLFKGKESIPISVLGGRGNDLAGFLAQIRRDMDAIDRFIEHHGDQVRVTIYEILFPLSILDANNIPGIRQVLGASLELIESLGPSGGISIFIEIPLDDQWRKHSKNLIQAIAAQNEMIAARPTAGNDPIFGVKIRCGGESPEAFPSPEQLAFILACARDSGVKMKATAGLHHPVRFYNDELGVKMHGFLNLLTAAAVAFARNGSMGELLAILGDENPEHFRFDEEVLTWKHHSIGCDKIREVREKGFISYGSCSFDEPREDLVELGLMKTKQEH